jgi:hypothetical protein
MSYRKELSFTAFGRTGGDGFSPGSLMVGRHGKPIPSCSTSPFRSCASGSSGPKPIVTTFAVGLEPVSAEVAPALPTVA